ncbi:hypothetical protein [Flavobacterium phragmitis]|uniref:Uncharacterized protein n=1 Tax=Flavobacterium phragmitis TaxID=739143 RepID=A0A1I1RUA8_9FLAO|nr:hypothetical protein [Flavobacterium phragmitis]SFD34230.1 hypothetical protein SAMN05216297_10711 [Flavobacterium phragmitis]
MKKATLTIGLFSLVMVATSFATPEIPTNFALRDTVPPIDGGAAGGVLKKPDRFAMNTELSKTRNVNFASVNQSVGNDKKVD